MTSDNRINARAYEGLVLSFPFLVLFCPRLNLGFTHARIDEMLVLVWLPLSIKHLLQSRYISGRNNIFGFIKVFLVLLGVFTAGLLYGEGAARWSASNIKLVTRPAVVIAYFLVVRYWCYRAMVNPVRAGVAVVGAILAAGLLGYIAMSSPALADSLVSTYSSGIAEYDDNYSFDMSRRAMSVFSGYDQASVTYSIALVLVIFLFFNSRRRLTGKFLPGLAMAGLLVSIMTSGRIGFVTAIVGGLVSLVLNMRGRAARMVPVAVFLAVLLVSAVPLGNLVIRNEETMQRFSDVMNLFDLASSTPLWERSSGVAGVVATQVLGIRYPTGMAMLTGFGDDGKFVSDVGYVTVFVKYGLVGIVAVISTLFVIAVKGRRIGKLVMSVSPDSIPLSAFLPGIAAIFFVGSMKGGLYFLTYKVGEIFAYILALCIVEDEISRAGMNGKNDLRMRDIPNDDARG